MVRAITLSIVLSIASRFALRAVRRRPGLTLPYPERLGPLSWLLEHSPFLARREGLLIAAH